MRHGKGGLYSINDHHAWHEANHRTITSTDTKGCIIPDSTQGTIKAGTSTGKITVRAADREISSDCYKEGMLTLESPDDATSLGDITFSKSPICADNKDTSEATLSPEATVTWSIPAPDLGCKIDTSGKITAGTTGGVIRVRASHAPPIRGRRFGNGRPPPSRRPPGHSRAAEAAAKHPSNRFDC